MLIKDNNESEQNVNNKKTICDIAVWYATKFGWFVFPVWWINPHTGHCACQEGPNCTRPGKHPLVGQWKVAATNFDKTIMHWWKKWPLANIAIITGRKSGLVVVDIDLKDKISGIKANLSFPDLVEEIQLNTNTITAITGSGGKHLFYKYPEIDKKIPCVTNLRNGIDIRADDGYVVVPPSIHISGKRYSWNMYFKPSKAKLLELNDKLLKLILEKKTPTKPPTKKKQKKDKDKDILLKNIHTTKFGYSLLRIHIKELNEAEKGTRNDTLNKISYTIGGYISTGFINEYEAIVELKNAAKKIGLSENEASRTIQSGIKNGLKHPMTPMGDSLTIRRLTDHGNAYRIIGEFGENIKYSTTKGKWYRWNKHVWKIDEFDTASLDLHISMLAIMQNETSNIDDKDEKKVVQKFINKSHNLPAINATRKLIKQFDIVTVNDRFFNRDKMKLNCLNGTINLKTGDLCAHIPDDYITKTIPVEYNRNAKCNRWMQFLNEIMDGNKEVIDYIQRAIGYSLTGKTKEQVFFIMHGDGANGKSTFIEVISELLGDYFKQADMNSFLETNQNNNIKNDLARLSGARFVTSSEIEQNKKLSESLVKLLTGSTNITARFLYKEYFSYKPNFKLWLETNHKPKIKGTDKGIWRRINLIPFNASFDNEKRDKDLREKLLNELPGILNWAIEGCVQWQKIGLGPPMVVLAANSEYQNEQDPIGEFLDNWCNIGNDYYTSTGSLYKGYQEWCKINGQKPWTHKAFSMYMKKKFEYKNVNGRKRIFIGVDLLPAYERFEDENFCENGFDGKF